MTIGHELNEAQRRAVAHGDGPALVIAGAGTGKTKTLACRVAHLVDSGVPPERILLLTFTRRAAREMLARAARRADPGVRGKVWGGTFHAVANRLLRLHGSAVGVPVQFTVMDQSDAADLMNLVRSESGLGSGSRRFPRKDTLAAIYSRAVNCGKPLSDVLRASFPWCESEADGVREVFDGYVARKRSRALLDFDDLLLYWRALVTESQVAAAVEARFDHVLVDEYQDTNALQASILLGLRRTNQNIMVVGDDAQAIYSFRSATVDNILRFPADFPGAEVIVLEHNYRSTQPVLDAANAVMAQARRRYTKDLFTSKPGAEPPHLVACADEGEQSDEVCRRVLAARERGVALTDQAVLFRAAHHSAALEIELAKRNIPFVKYGGLRFVEAAHIKDLIGTLRILENPYDELAWFRVLQLVEGVGPRLARAVMAEIGVMDGPGTLSPLRRFIDDPPRIPRVPAEAITPLRMALDACSSDPPPQSQIEVIRRFYEPVLERAYESAPGRARDLEQLEQIAARYRSRAQMIADLTLDPPVSTSDLAGPPHVDEDYLILSTIHSAKGGEWSHVHVIHATDGNIPSDMATGDVHEIEEERRLFYVALTRAKAALCVYAPLRYYHNRPGLSDAHSYAQPSRFITSEVRAAFTEAPASGVVEAEDGLAPAPTAAERAVESYLADLFRL